MPAPNTANSTQRQETILDFEPKKMLNVARYNADFCRRCIDVLERTSERFPKAASPIVGGSRVQDSSGPSLESQIEGMLLGGLLGSAISHALNAVKRRGMMLQLNHHSSSEIERAEHQNPFAVWARDLASSGSNRAALVLQMNGLQVSP